MTIAAIGVAREGHLGADISELRPAGPNERIALLPGTTATAEIINGESIVVRYLTRPILQTSSEALGER